MLVWVKVLKSAHQRDSLAIDTFLSSGSFIQDIHRFLPPEFLLDLVVDLRGSPLAVELAVAWFERHRKAKTRIGV